MNTTQYLTKEEVLKRAQEIIGIPLKEVDKTGRLATGKGAIGTVIEESWFGYKPNSHSCPDFPEAGVELKVTPYLKSKGKIRAKERLVCNIINYMEEFNKTFKTSSFWLKCHSMLLLSYEHLFNCSKGDYTIDAAILYEFPESDLIIIEHDWKIIIDKIRAGKAHEISEGDTLYLSACTKGASSASVREQPFSDIKAKQRAYSLKSSYMTQVLNKYIFGDVQDEHIIRDVSDLYTTTFENYILNKVSQFYGMSQAQLKNHFNITSNSKNINELILGKMLGIKGKIRETEEFKKASIIPKTIRIQKNGKIKENMSFPYFDFIKLSKETEWENSILYSLLAPTKFMFVIFRENEFGEYIFEKIKFWNMPYADLCEVKKVWEKTIQIINDGVILTKTNRGICNNLPKQADSYIAHVRPHGKDSSDKLPLPDGRMMTKQSFWLNAKYVEKIIK